jgi:malate dehydrogenase
MAFLTNEKLTIVGAAGMIGSNMAQSALMMGLTSEICLYDVFSPEGVAEENAKLDQSYEHLCKMRDELVTLNIVPPISEWNKINPNL